MATLFLIFIGAYLVGSIPVAYLYCRARGKDIRAFGSGNVGATNAGRLFGPWAFGTVFLLDFLKGFVPVFIVVIVLPPESQVILAGPVLALSATVIGHIWTVFLGFKGGKGVATSLGGLLALMPLVSGLTLLVFLLILWRTRIVSASSLGAALFFGTTSWFFRYPLPYCLLSTALTALIFFTHRSNITRLREGRELKIGNRKN